MRSPLQRGAWPWWVLLVPLGLLALVSARWIAAAMPTCFLYEKTGLLCPGCGSTRSALALSEGRVMVALQNNLLFAGGAIFGGLWILLAGLRLRFPRLRFLRIVQARPWFLWLVLGVLVGYWVARNLPGFEWLRPQSW